jgi:hypothetical protein
VTPAWLRTGLVVSAVALSSVSCTPDQRIDTATTRTPEAPDESSPFTVGGIPEGYRPVTAGRGTWTQDWGVDETGTHEPFTVLSRSGEPDGDGVVVISKTGFAGYQGGLAQASQGYPGGYEELTVDGRDALFTAATADAWADLVAMRDDDLAVRVTAPDATVDELVDVLGSVDAGTDPTKAPVVEDAPRELEVVGSVDVDGVLAQQPWLEKNSPFIPGPESAHAAGWTVGTEEDGTDLVVLTLPAGAADPDVVRLDPGILRAGRTVTAREVDVNGRRGVYLEEAMEGSDVAQRSVWVESDWGDIVVVSALGRSVPDEATLLDLASSVRRADRPTWDAFVIESTGGPGLHPDEGRRELARGRSGDLEWLLQSGPPGGGMIGGDGISTDPTLGVDPCLKLSNRLRVCPNGGGGGSTGDDWIRSHESAGNHDIGSFVVVSTSVQGAVIRVTTPTGTGDGELRPVVGGSVWTAVAFVDGPGSPTCDAPGGPSPESPTSTMRVEVLDGTGRSTWCLGGLGPTPIEP